MNIERVKRLLKQKENIRLEFKEAVTALPGNLFETICAMLNRDGGDGNQDAISVAVRRLIDGGVSGGVSGGVNDGVNDGVRKEIIEVATIILNYEGLKTFEIAAKSGRAIRTTERYLKLARQFGIIEFRGASKTGGYYVTKSLKDIIENKNKK